LKQFVYWEKEEEKEEEKEIEKKAHGCLVCPAFCCFFKQGSTKDIHLRGHCRHILPWSGSGLEFVEC